MNNSFLSEIESIVRRVRNMVLPYYGKTEYTFKSDNSSDIVTQLDVQVEQFLKEELAKIAPDIEFVGEETGGNRDASRKWLCDPIDGTIHFVRGLPFCTTMLALVEHGTVTHSVIYDFVSDVMYSAKRGEGAFANGVPIHVSQRPLKQAYLSIETRMHIPQNATKFLGITEHCSFLKLACAGYEFILVATGKIEGRICFDPYGKDYDYAAGSLLVEEAGGVVVNIGKTTYDYTNLNFLAVNQNVYPELLEVLSRNNLSIEN